MATSGSNAPASYASAASKAKQPLTKEQVLSRFNELRQQQRMLATRLSEIEMDMKEHDLVIDVLKGVDAARKCYRLVGGVLVERTVDVVLPSLTTNRGKMNDLTAHLKKTLESKGNEINTFRENYGILIKGEDGKDDKEPESASKQADRPANILAPV